MNLLHEIVDAPYPGENMGIKYREAARAILFDEHNAIPLLFVAKYNYHKLPGGGVDAGENRAQALIRECKEEVGSTIEVLGEIGKIIEFRSEYNLKQTSYCYHGKILTKGHPDFTEKEQREGFCVIWMPLQDAIQALKNDLPENYEGKFVQERDLAFLKKAAESIGINKT